MVTLRQTFVVLAVLPMLMIPAVAMAACKDVQTTSKMCLFDPYCAPDLETGSSRRPVYENGQPKCESDLHTLTQVNSVDNACETAKDLRQPLNCALGCTPGNISENSTTDAKCCSITFERPCTAAAAQENEEEKQ